MWKPLPETLALKTPGKLEFVIPLPKNVPLYGTLLRVFKPKNKFGELWHKNNVSSKSSVFTTLISTVSMQELFE